jgi:hypothetical protein
MKQLNSKAEISYEHLEMAKYSGNIAYDGTVARFLQEKYAANQPDLIVTYRYPAANFMLQYGEEIFPGAPSILTLDESESVISADLPPNYKAVIGTYDKRKAVSLILQTQPKTEKIYV